MRSHGARGVCRIQAHYSLHWIAGLLERSGLDLSQLSSLPRTESGEGAQNPNDSDKLGGATPLLGHQNPSC